MTSRSFRLSVETFAIGLIIVALSTTAITAQEPITMLPRWVFEQGGLTVALFVIGYFYRRDLLDQSAERKAEIDKLIIVLEQNTEAKTKLFSVVDGLTTEIRDRERRYRSRSEGY